MNVFNNYLFYFEKIIYYYFKNLKFKQKISKKWHVIKMTICTNITPHNLVIMKIFFHQKKVCKRRLQHVVFVFNNWKIQCVVIKGMFFVIIVL